ncbi:MAG TPA: molecular chaperone TorD family protein [Symbiobacteriaceae bacterium]|jgi:TorA maturation chaperone TorD|nr:molecular chaperone TorD family protein [Symbiobacteriaceae bacterium]
MPDPGAIAFLETRLTLYYLLQRAYAAPCDPDLSADLSEAAIVYGSLLDWPSREIAPVEPDRDGPEYHRLFVGPGRVVASPYESVYTSPDGLLMRDATLFVKAFYLEFGLAETADHSEPEDHLATELEFYAFLQAKLLTALRDGQNADAVRWYEAQERFWREHLSNWVSPFAQRVLDDTCSPFYRSLAALTKVTVHAEKQVLQALTAILPAKEEPVHA